MSDGVADCLCWNCDADCQEECSCEKCERYPDDCQGKQGVNAECKVWDEREVKTTCDDCECNLYEGDTYWGNNQYGTYCEECAEKEIAEWWGII